MIILRKMKCENLRFRDFVFAFTTKRISLDAIDFIFQNPERTIHIENTIIPSSN
jgi:hypothetical protein